MKPSCFLFFSDHLKPIWVKVAVTSGVWWCFFLRFNFWDTNEKWKRRWSFQHFYRIISDRALCGDDHRISLHYQPQCEQTCLKYTTKIHVEVVTPCFVACFCHPKNSAKVVRGTQNWWWLHMPWAQQGGVFSWACHWGKFHGFIALFLGDGDPMKFITIWENIFNDFFEELQSPRKLDSSVFFCPSNGRHDFWSPAWDVMD